MAELNLPEPWDIAVETLGTEQVGWGDESAIVIRTPVELAEVLDAIAARRAVPAQASAPAAVQKGLRLENERESLVFSMGVAAGRGTEDAEFLSLRLARVAKLSGVSMPAMSHADIAACAGTILGDIARALAAQSPSQGEMDAGPAAALEEVWIVGSKTFSVVCATEEIANSFVSATAAASRSPSKPRREGSMDKRTCDECRFAVNEDNGYSNWTVEGTEFSCAKKLHPNGTFDRFYGANPKLDYAEKCQGFEAGEGIDMDVECDGVADLTPEKKIVWDMHQEPMAIEQHIKGGGNGN